MPDDAELTQIGVDIQARKREYRGRIEARVYLGKTATARLRAEQCDSLLQIIQDAQLRINAGFRPDDTDAQINEIIRTCNETSTIRSSLAALATRLRTCLDARRRWLGRREDVLATQSGAWNAQRAVIDVLIDDPNTGGKASKVDVQCAIQFLKADGQYRPEVPEDPELSDQYASITLGDEQGISSCHPTAEGLQAILGQANGYFATAGGAGPERRAEAISLACAALGANTPARVIWFKCTATGDGHSFTLVKKPSGSVDVLEAWANPGGNGYLKPLRRQLKHSIARQDAVTAVTRLNSDQSGTRDEGYAALSTAYGGVDDEPSHHFEELNSDGDHDSDENISIVCTVRDLASYETVQGRMRARYQVLAGLRRRLGL